MLQPTVSRLNISNHYNDLMCEVSALVELMGNVAGSMDRSDDEMSTGDMASWIRCSTSVKAYAHSCVPIST